MLGMRCQLSDRLTRGRKDRHIRPCIWHELRLRRNRSRCESSLRCRCRCRRRCARSGGSGRSRLPRAGAAACCAGSLEPPPLRICSALRSEGRLFSPGVLDPGDHHYPISRRSGCESTNFVGKRGGPFARENALESRAGEGEGPAKHVLCEL